MAVDAGETEAGELAGIVYDIQGEETFGRGRLLRQMET